MEKQASGTKTVLITGTTSGIGRATALKFLEEGWNVVAIVQKRTEAVLPSSERLLLLELDVTDKEKIPAIVREAIAWKGGIDVIVNNAGYGLLGAFEYASEAEIEHEFATNFFAILRVTKEILPHFRERKSGVIVNISSMLGRIGLPFFSLYAATKWAVDGWSESMQYELEPFHIRIKIIEPGTVKTNFFANSLRETHGDISEYNTPYSGVIANTRARGELGEDPANVATIIYRAATDGSNKLRYVADSTARLLTNLHRFMPFWLFKFIIKNSVK